MKFWINEIVIKAFLCATTFANYEIRLGICDSMPNAPIELVNERTQEKLTLIRASNFWVMKRGPIGETAVQWEDKNWANELNGVFINLRDVNCIGPLSAEEEVGQSTSKGH